MHGMKWSEFCALGRILNNLTISDIAQKLSLAVFVGMNLGGEGIFTNIDNELYYNYRCSCFKE